MSPSSSLRLAVAMLLLTLAAPAFAQVPGPRADLAVTDLRLAGATPRWVEARADPGHVFLEATIENLGSAPASGYRIDYFWVPNAGAARWLNGVEERSFDVAEPEQGPLGPGQSRRLPPFNWTLQPDQAGAGKLRIVLEPVGPDRAAANDAREASVFVQVRDVDLSVSHGVHQLHDPQETAFARAQLYNRGNVAETIQLQLLPGRFEPAERAGDLVAALQEQALVVPPGQVRHATLLVDYSFSGLEGAFDATYPVRAATTYGATLEAHGAFSSGSGELAAGSPATVTRTDERPLSVSPGAAATWGVRLTNVGTRPDVYRIEAFAPDRWTATLALDSMQDQAAHRIALLAGESRDVRLNVRAPTDATPGSPAEAGLVVASLRPAQPVRMDVPLRIVGPALRIEPGPGLQAQPYLGDPISIPVVVANDGDTATQPDIKLTLVGAGTSWTQALEPLGAGQTRSVTVAGGAPYSTPGPETLLVELRSPQGAHHMQPLRQEVFVHEASAAIRPPGSGSGMPGQTVGYRAGAHAFTVTNTGNTQETFHAHAVASAGAAAIVNSPVFTLAKGQTRTVSVDHILPLPSGLVRDVNLTLFVSVAGRPSLSWSAQAVTHVVDQASPRILATTSPALWALGATLSLHANATDDSALASVHAIHTLPNGTRRTIPLVPAAGSWHAKTSIDAAGNHTLQYRALDAHGNNASTTPVTFAVRSILPPSITLDGPGEGAIVEPEATFRATIKDSLPLSETTLHVRAGQVTLLTKALPLLENQTSFSLDGIPDGTVIITVQATNVAGANRTIVRNVTVQAPAPVALPQATAAPANEAPVPGVAMGVAALGIAARLLRTRPIRSPPPRRRPQTWGAAAFLLLLSSMVAGLPPAAEAAESTGVEWWGSTQAGQGFHLRVPVTARNSGNYPIENGMVLAQLDVAAKLVEAGWVSQARSDDDLLRSFELDTASVRVVAMTDLQPRTPTSTHGRLALYTSQFPPGDLRRHEVPSTHFQGLLLDPEADRYDARTNPAITVLWRVPGIVPPGAERHFVVYFDTKTNAVERSAPNYSGIEGASALERTFWSGPGTDLIGFAASAQRYQVAIIGMHDDTRVTLLLGQDDGFVQKTSTSSQPNPVRINAHEQKSVLISQNEGRPFRMVADKPILALVASEGFVPTPAGNLLAKPGESFHFSTTHDANLMQDGLYFFSASPTRAATSIRLHNLADGSFQDITLDGGGNPYPYTVGSGHQVDSSMGDCNPVPGVRTALVAGGPGRYRADVLTGGPVALLYEPAQGVTQIPSADGTPLGTRFWTSTSKTTCQGVTQQNHFYAVAGQPTDFGVYNTWETPQARLFPSPPCAQEPCGAGQPIGPLPQQAFLRHTFTGLGQIPDRPVVIKTGAPAAVFTGPQPMPPSLAGVPLRGPLGGAGVARVFDGFGAAAPILYAPFDDTQVRADIHYSSGEPAIDAPLNLLAGRMAGLPTRPGTSILSYHIESDRPIVVLPRGAAPGFLAGIPPMLEAIVHAAEYRGHLVEVRSPTGLSPVSESTVPGQPLHFPLDIINRGRGAGNANLPDTVELSILGKPPGWTATFSQPNVPLDGGQARRITLTVTPPSDAATETVTAMTVHAMSRGNPRANHTLDVNTFIKSAFGVGIWFDGVETEGKKVDRAAGPRGVAINYTLYVQNRGTVPDRIVLDVTPQSWDAILLQDGRPVGHVDLPAYRKDDPKASAAKLTLQVTPPADGAEAFLQTTVTAASASSAADRDKVFAFSKLSVPSDVQLELVNRTTWVLPGGQAQFNFTLHNVGLGGTQAFFDLRSDLLPGWEAPQVLRRMPGGSLLPFPTTPPQVSLGAGQLADFAIVARSAPSALAGDAVALRLQVGTRDGTLEAFMDAIVLPMHRIETSLTPVTLPIEGGQARTLEARLSNSGNLDEFLQLSPGNLPPRWRMTFPAEDVPLPRGATQALKVKVEAPPGVEKGTYPLAFIVRSKDGAMQEVPFKATVGAFAAHAATGRDQVLAQPGQTIWAERQIRNDGNTLLAVSLQAAEGEPWPLVGTDITYDVPPGANTTIAVGWKVPRGAPDGLSTHTARLVLRSDDPGVASLEDLVEVRADVGRADLAVVEARSFPGPAGQIVRIVVENQGNRPAHGVIVELVAAAGRIDHATFAEMPAQSQRNVTLLRPDGALGDVMVRVDPDGEVVETDTANNVAYIAVELEAAPEAAFHAWIVMAALLAAAFVWRRHSPIQSNPAPRRGVP